MSEPPREPAARILTWRTLAQLLVFGAVMATGTLAVVHWGPWGAPERASTMAFTTFVLFQVFNVFNVRSGNGSAFRRTTFTNVQLWLALGAVVALQIASVHWSPFQGLFRSTALGVSEWATCVVIASTVLVVEELRKLGARGLRATTGVGK